jgi:hypothetical protein
MLMGISGLPLAVVASAGLAAVVSQIEATPTPTEELLWQHEHVVEALMDSRTVLPVRFGTLLHDRAAVERTLHEGQARFQADLAKLRGRVELALRVLTTEDRRPETGEPELNTETQRRGDAEGTQHAVRSSSGTAYMLARLEEERRQRAEREAAETLVAALHARLEPLAVEWRHKLLASPQLLLTAAYLVERDKLPAFQAAVAELSQQHPNLKLLCTGPWPGYHFVG